MNIRQHLRCFASFAGKKAAACAADPAPILLKRRHTMHVYANASRIARREKFSPRLVRICALAALYHDLARFDQYLQYGTFKDAHSRNHGLWAVELLRKNAILADEPPEDRRAILTAIAVHNRKALPQKLPPLADTAARVTRDADKLDILRVMDEHLSAGGPYNPTVVLSLPDSDAHGENVTRAALARRTASYEDLRSVNDFRLLLGAWLFDMNFAASRSMFISAGHARRIVAALPANAVYGEARAFILDCLRDPAASTG